MRNCGTSLRNVGTFWMISLIGAYVNILVEGWVYRNSSALSTTQFMVSDFAFCVSTDEFTASLYKSVIVVSLPECLTRCEEDISCGHVMFCARELSCYLESEQGKEPCGAECTKCPCFYNTVRKIVSRNATCEASSEFWSVDHFHPCGGALDGITGNKDWGQNWGSQGENVNAWIKFYLDKPYVVGSARIMQRMGKVERNKDIQFTFSDNSSQVFTLPFIDTDGFFWDVLVLQPVETEWVSITILSVYTANNNGFGEVEVYAHHGLNTCSFPEK